MLKFNRLVAYGCSITSGFELADHTVSNLSEFEINKIKKNKGIEYWVDFLETKITEKELRQKESELSWPTYIADYLNLNYLNRAVPGGNSQSTIYLLENDIENGTIRDDDLILIGHTEFSRWFWINENNEPYSGCIGGTLRRWPSKTFYREFIKYVANDNFFIWQWHHDIKYLDMLSDRLHGRILQVYCYKPLSQIIKEKNYYFKNYKFKSVLDHYFSFDLLVDWNNESHVHGFTHPKVEFHKKFAEKFIPLIQSNFQTDLKD